MIHSQGNENNLTELLTIGKLKLPIGTPEITQKWVEEFLASRRQGLSIRTLEYYRDILFKLVGTALTPKGINACLTSLSLGNAKLNYYQVLKIFCSWLKKSKKIENNPLNLVDRPKIKNKILPAITTEQLDTLLDATENERDKCIIKLFFNSGIRLSELVGIKDTDFDWNKYGVQSMLRRLETKTGIECNPHTFRRGFANSLFNKGLSTRAVMALGGWEDIKTVEKYSKRFSQEDALKLYSKNTA